MLYYKDKLQLILYFIVIALFSLLFTQNTLAQENYQKPEIITGKVLEIISEEKQQLSEDESIIQQHIKVQLQNKEIIETINEIPSSIAYKVILKKNDRILLHEEDGAYFVEGYHIEYTAYILIAIFLSLILIIGGVKGVLAILSLGVQGGLLFYFLIPMLKEGLPPVLIASIYCAIATFLTMIIIAGFNKKSLSATIGTIGGVVISGILGIWAVKSAKLTGLLESEMQSIFIQLPQIHLPELIAAGVLIGSLGAAMDVAMSIASALAEVKEIAPHKTFQELYKSGMNIGKDIMGTMVNTLILAYAGSSIAMIILFTMLDMQALINSELLMKEVIFSFIGSIGLILTIPITALISSYLYSLPKK